MTRRIGIRVLVALTAALTALVLVVWLGVRTPWFREWARDEVTTRVNNTINGHLTIGSLSGSLFTGVVLHDVSLSDSDGPIVNVEKIEATYDVFGMFSGDIPIEDLELTRPVVTLVSDQRGWNVTRLAPKTEDTGGGRGFLLRRVQIVDGAVDARIDGERTLSVSRLDLIGTLRVGAEGTHLGIDRATLVDNRSGSPLDASGARFTLDDTGMAVTDAQIAAPGVELSGDVIFPDDTTASMRLDLHVDLDGWTAATYAAYLPPALETLPAVTGDVRVQGPAHALRTQWTLAMQDATTTGALVADVTAEQPAIQGTMAVRRLDPAVFTGDPRLSGRISADLDIDGTIDVDAPLQSRATFTLHGNGLEVTGYHAEHVRADGVLETGTLRATTVIAAYGARTRADVRMSHLADASRRVLTASGVLEALDVSRLPVDNVPAIPTSIDGRFDAEVAADAWSATFTADESTVADGVIEAGSIVRATSRGRALDASVSARVRDVSSAMWPEPPARETTVTGAIDAEVSVPDVEASDLLDAAAGRVQATLGRSTVMGTSIARADVEASLAAGVVTVDALEVEGPATTLQASGTLAVGEQTDASSDLTLEAGVTDLSALPPQLVTGLRGGAQIVATVGGTATDPAATGTFNLREPGYKDVADALAMTGTFDVAFPDRDLDRLAANVDVDGTFVTVSDQELQAVTLAARYEANQVDLTATLDQENRSIELDGGLAVFPDYREIQLRELTLSGLGAPWRLESDETVTTIRYGEEDVRLDGLTFVRGVERIHMAGTVGLPDGPASSDLSVTLERLNVGDLVTLSTGESRVRGTASGSVRVTGAIDNPDATASLSLTDGAVADVPFTLARADVKLGDRVATVTGHVEEANGATLSIEGSVPVGGDAAAPLDVRVKSSAISLGLLASLTTHLTDITGTAVLDVQATGTLADPALAGTMEVADGALTVAPTGVRYEDIDIGIRLDGDAIAIERAALADANGHTLTMTGGGTLLTNNGERTVAIDVSADGISLLDNELGDVDVTVDARIDGRLASPSLTGRVTVNQGRIEVDELLPRLGATTDAPVVVPTPGAPATATVATEVAAPAPGTAPDTPATNTGDADVPAVLAEAGPVAEGVIDLEMTMPDNLVLRGRDIRTAAGSLGLGDMNLTVGGTVAIRRSADDPLRVVGAIEVVRGYYEFQGRRFDVEEGSEIRFRGGDTIDPALNVTAEREVSGIVARVAVSGTAERPRITLSSDPPLDESDVLSLVVFNQPMSQLGESEQVDLLDRAGSMALGTLATGLADSIGRALDVDLFEIHAPSADGSGDVTLGTQVNDRLFVGFRQEFGSAGASRLSFEYRLTEFLRILTSVGHGGDRGRTTRDREATGADLVFRVRY